MALGCNCYTTTTAATLADPTVASPNDLLIGFAAIAAIGAFAYTASSLNSILGALPRTMRYAVVDQIMNKLTGLWWSLGECNKLRRT